MGAKQLLCDLRAQGSCAHKVTLFSLSILVASLRLHSLYNEISNRLEGKQSKVTYSKKGKTKSIFSTEAPGR